MLKILRRKNKEEVTDQGRSSPLQRFERKFFILPKNIGFAYSLLRQFCRPDKDYPISTVHSLYFDTIDLEQYNRSTSGDFNKDKVRIRWYDEESIEADTVPVFIELKTRHGFASSKQRERIVVPAEDIEPSSLIKGIVSKTALNNIIAGFGYFPELPLRPIIKISYHRYRFTEMVTGTRVSLDYDIHSTMIAPELGRREHDLRLEGGVVEVKGPSMELPLTLRKMRILDTDWSRFSKYSNCIDSHLSDPGAVARFAPPGRILES
ncbi:MAG: VTC domain-containing protein [Dehalococcoidales bacterium]|nr:MAG: VTC domain-containing protein [Dehalococcoidales bacterium]